MARPKKTRVKIPAEVVARALFLSEETCCRCRTARKDVQTHHINDDPSDNSDENIAVLCIECHNLTLLKGGFGRRLNADLVRLHRDAWLKTVAEKRAREAQAGATQPSPGSVHPEASPAAAAKSEVRLRVHHHAGQTCCDTSVGGGTIISVVVTNQGEIVAHGVFLELLSVTVANKAHPPIGTEGRLFKLAGTDQESCDLGPGESRHFQVVSSHGPFRRLLLSKAGPNGWSFIGSPLEMEVRAGSARGERSAKFGCRLEADGPAAPMTWVPGNG